MDDVTVYYTASLKVYPRVYQATYHALDRKIGMSIADVTEINLKNITGSKTLQILMQSLRIRPKIAVWQRLTHRPSEQIIQVIVIMYDDSFESYERMYLLLACVYLNIG